MIKRQDFSEKSSEVIERLESILPENKLFIGLFALSAIAFLTVSANNTIDAGAVGNETLFYPMETGVGSTVYDYSDNSHQGSISGATWTSGVRGDALSFDGTDDYIAINKSYSTSGALPEVTVCSWFKTSSGSAQNLVSFDRSEYFRLHAVDANSEANVSFSTTTGDSTTDDLISDTVVDDNEWHFACGVFNGSATDDKKIYIDGQLDSSSDGHSTDTALGSGTTRYGFVGVGSEASSFDGGQGPNHDMDGKIDNVRIYEEALSADEIESLYNNGALSTGEEDTDTGGKVLHISFDHFDGSTILDESGSDYDSSTNGAEPAKAYKCRVGRCYTFNGTKDEVDVGGFTPNNNQDYTFMAWAKPDDTSSGLIMGDNPTCWNGINLYTDSGNAGFAISNESGSNDCIAQAESSIDIGEWHHLAGTVDVSSGDIELFIDGKRVATDTGYDGEVTGGNSIDIGSDETSGPEFPFEGEIDEVKVFDKVLTQREIIREAKRLDGRALDLRFDAGTGATAYDSSFHQNDGELKPGESTGPNWVKGVSGTALSLDGSDDWVSTNEDLSTSSFTVSLWANFDSFTNNQRMITEGESGGGDQSMIFWHDSGDSRVEFLVYDKDNSNYVNAAGSDISENKWYHFVGVFDGEDLTLYRNGDVDATAQMSGSMRDSSKKIAIGAGSGGTGDYVDGEIDNVKILSIAATEKEVKQLYKQGSSKISDNSFGVESGKFPDDNIVMEHSFDKANSTHALDTSGYQNHAILDTGTEWRSGSDCLFGRCLYFSANENDRVTVPDSESVDINNDITISMWVKSFQQDQADYTFLIRKEDFPGTFSVVANEVTRTAFRVANSTGDNKYLTDNDAIPYGKWTHLVYRYNPSTGLQKIFLNGKETESQDIGDITPLYDTNADVEMGGRGPQPFKGYLDQVKLYNTSLSDDEIFQLYSKGRDRIGNNELFGPEAHWRIDERSNPVPDVAGDADMSLSMIGESGTFNTSDGKWKEVEFERNYKDPVIVGTTNTKAQSGNALIFEARDVRSDSATVRLCESEGGSSDGCDTHGTERAGYIVIDAEGANQFDGLEAGSFLQGQGVDTDTTTVSFDENFGSTPVVIPTVQRVRGLDPIGTRVIDTTTSDFTAAICYQDETDSCLSTQDQTELGWIAFEPGNLPFEQQAEAGTISSAGATNYDTVTFSSSFSEKPVVAGAVQTNSGGHELEITEADKVGTSSADFRFCELDDGDTCDGHSDDDIGWVAVENGVLTNTAGVRPEYVSGRDDGRALKFDGSDDYLNYKDLSTTGPSKSWTVSTWIKLDTMPGNNPYFIWHPRAEYDMSINVGTDDRITMRTYDGSNHDLSGPTLETGEWYHTTFVYNVTSSNYNIYLDGSLEKQGTLSDPNSVSDKNLVGGQFVSGSLDQKYFDGKIDDLRIYPYALTGNQVSRVHRKALSSGN